MDKKVNEEIGYKPKNTLAFTILLAVFFFVVGGFWPKVIGVIFVAIGLFSAKNIKDRAIMVIHEDSISVFENEKERLISFDDIEQWKIASKEGISFTIIIKLVTGEKIIRDTFQKQRAKAVLNKAIANKESGEVKRLKRLAKRNNEDYEMSLTSFFNRKDEDDD